MSDTKNLAYWRKRGLELMVENVRLREALRVALYDIEAEFRAMGDDWKEHPIMRKKNKNLNKARALLAKGAA
jgi:hypothetical protein